MTMPWGLILFGVGLLLLGTTGVAMASSIERANAAGYVEADPSSIAAAHGVSLNVEALARMMVSEVGSKEAAQIAVGWAARNMASKRGESISKLLLRSKGVADGHFGWQKTGGRYASTRLPSTPASRALATKVLAGSIKDPTGGAVQFDAPEAQDKLVASGEAGYNKTAAEVAASRAADGKVAVMVPGVSTVRFWVPTGGKVA